MEALWRARFILMNGAAGTLWLGAAVLIAAPALGAMVFALQAAAPPKLKHAVEWYVDVMRAFPLLMLLVIAYYLLLPAMGMNVDPFLAATVGFTLKHGAYFSEIYRAGWLSVDRGQFMAAEAIGLARWQTVRLVVWPQMLRITIPMLTSQATLVVRDLPLAFIIGYFEVLTSARAAQAFTRNSTPLVGAVLFYAAALLALQWAASRAEGGQRTWTEV